jgi:hypothetical protein
MAVSPLASDHVPNPYYYAGRNARPRLVVLHTAECPCQPGRARSTCEFLARPTVRASTHYAVDPTTICSQIDEDDTAWAAPGANSDGIQIEQAAYAGWSAEWAGEPVPTMLRLTAALVADICARQGIPLVHLTNAQLAAGQRGIITHNQASEVYRQSDHWDCGPQFPIDQVITWAKGGTYPTPTPPPTDEDDHVRFSIMDEDGSLYLGVDNVLTGPFSNYGFNTVRKAAEPDVEKNYPLRPIRIDKASLATAYTVIPLGKTDLDDDPSNG